MALSLTFPMVALMELPPMTLMGTPLTALTGALLMVLTVILPPTIHMDVAAVGVMGPRGVLIAPPHTTIIRVEATDTGMKNGLVGSIANMPRP